MNYSTNSKHTREQIDKHIMEYYPDISDLAADYHAVSDKAQSLVEGGSFLISYFDQREFLDTLHLNNNSGREFSDDQVFKMYVLLVSRGIERLVAKNNKFINDHIMVVGV
jgi:hypothetical protein